MPEAAEVIQPDSLPNRELQDLVPPPPTLPIAIVAGDGSPFSIPKPVVPPSVSAVVKKGVSAKAVEFLDECMKKPGFTDMFLLAFPGCKQIEVREVGNASKPRFSVDSKDASRVQWELPGKLANTSGGARIAGFGKKAVARAADIRGEAFQGQEVINSSFELRSERAFAQRLLFQIADVVGGYSCGQPICSDEIIKCLTSFMAQPFSKTEGPGSSAALLRRAQMFGAGLSKSKDIVSKARDDVAKDPVGASLAWAIALRDMCIFTHLEGHDLERELNRSSSVEFTKIEQPTYFSTSIPELQKILIRIQGMQTLGFSFDWSQTHLAGKSTSPFSAIVSNLHDAIPKGLTLVAGHIPKDTQPISGRAFEVAQSFASALGALGWEKETRESAVSGLTAVVLPSVIRQKVKDAREIIAATIARLSPTVQSASSDLGLPPLPSLSPETVHKDLVTSAAEVSSWIEGGGTDMEAVGRFVALAFALRTCDLPGISSLKQALAASLGRPDTESAFWSRLTNSWKELQSSGSPDLATLSALRDSAAHFFRVIIQDIGRNVGDAPVTAERLFCLDSAFELLGTPLIAGSLTDTDKDLALEMWLDGTVKAADLAFQQKQYARVAEIEHRADERLAHSRIVENAKSLVLRFKLATLVADSVKDLLKPAKDQVIGNIENGQWSEIPTALETVCNAVKTLLSSQKENPASDALLSALQTHFQVEVIDPLIKNGIAGIRSADQETAFTVIQILFGIKTSLAGIPGMKSLEKDLEVAANAYVAKFADSTDTSVSEKNWAVVALTCETLSKEAEKRADIPELQGKLLARCIEVRDSALSLLLPLQSQLEDAVTFAKSAGDIDAEATAIVRYRETEAILQTFADPSEQSTAKSEAFANDLLLRASEPIKAAVREDDLEEAAVVWARVKALQEKIGGVVPPDTIDAYVNAVYDRWLSHVEDADYPVDQVFLVPQQWFSMATDIDPLDRHNQHQGRKETLESRVAARVVECVKPSLVEALQDLQFSTLGEQLTALRSYVELTDDGLNGVRYKIVQRTLDVLSPKLAEIVRDIPTIGYQSPGNWKKVEGSAVTERMMGDHIFFQVIEKLAFVVYALRQLDENFGAQRITSLRALHPGIKGVTDILHPQIRLPLGENDVLGFASAFLTHAASEQDPSQVEDEKIQGIKNGVERIAQLVWQLTQVFPDDDHVRTVAKTLANAVHVVVDTFYVEGVHLIDPRQIEEWCPRQQL